MPLIVVTTLFLAIQGHCFNLLMQDNRVMNARIRLFEPTNKFQIISEAPQAGLEKTEIQNYIEKLLLGKEEKVRGGGEQQLVLDFSGYDQGAAEGEIQNVNFYHTIFGLRVLNHVGKMSFVNSIPVSYSTNFNNSATWQISNCTDNNGHSLSETTQYASSILGGQLDKSIPVEKVAVQTNQTTLSVAWGMTINNDEGSPLYHVALDSCNLTFVYFVNYTAS